MSTIELEIEPLRRTLYDAEGSLNQMILYRRHLPVEVVDAELARIRRLLQHYAYDVLPPEEDDE